MLPPSARLVGPKGRQRFLVERTERASVGDMTAGGVRER